MRARLTAFAAMYVAIAVAYTWPLAVRLNGVAHDRGDPLLTTWILWWSGTQAVPLTARWWNAPAFFPSTGVLAFSEHLLGLVPVAAPLTLITGEPLVGANVTLIATFALSALAAHVLAFTLTRRHDAAFVAALAFGFAPYRLSQVPHIQVLSSYWAPLCLAALHRYAASRRPLWAAAAAFAWLMQALSCGYYLFFLSMLLALWFFWFAVGRWRITHLVTIAVCFIAAALVLAPILYGYRSILGGVYGFRRSFSEIQVFSADAAGLLSASPELLVWRWVRVLDRPESELFPGITIVALMAIAAARARPFGHVHERGRGMALVRAGLALLLVLLIAAAAVPIAHGAWRLTVGRVRLVSIGRADKPLSLALVTALALMAALPRVRAACRARSALAFYLAAAFVTWLCALGPTPTFMNRPALYLAPYGWLMEVPGFDGLRVPARFWMITLVCLSAVAALAVNRLDGRSRRAVVIVAAIGLLVDGWPRAFTVFPAPETRPSPADVVARLELPMSDDVDPAAVYLQSHDRVPLVNGFSGYSSPHYYALRTLLRARDPRILHVLAANGPIAVLVDHARDPDGAIRRFVASHPGAVRVRDEPSWSSYRLPRSADAPSIAEPSGTPLTIASLSTFPNAPQAASALDGNLETGWSGGVQQQTADATIDLGRPSYVGQVVIELGAFVTDFPMRLQIDISSDGDSWTIAWAGDTALHAYFGAVRRPRQLPLVFPVNREGVRFIRLRQTGFGTHDWTIPELNVRGR